MCKWGAVLFVAFESKVSRREDVQCWWAFLWCGDAGRFFNGVLFGGVNWFNKGRGGGRNGWGGIVESVVLVDSEVLLEVVLLVQLIV